MLIKWLIGPDQAVTGDFQAADWCLSRGCIGAFQSAEWAVVKQLTGSCQAADKHCSGDCVGTDCGAQYAQINWLKDAIRAAESVLFNRLKGKWSSADQAADRCLTSG